MDVEDGFFESDADAWSFVFVAFAVVDAEVGGAFLSDAVFGGCFDVVVEGFNDVGWFWHRWCRVGVVDCDLRFGGLL